MEAPEDQDSNRRRRRLRLAYVVGAVGATGVIAGVVFVTRSPEAGAKVAELAASTNRVLGRPLTDAVAHVSRSARSVEASDLVDKGSRVADQLVQAHTKMQAHGPNWSMHRPISVGPYVRMAATSA